MPSFLVQSGSSPQLGEMAIQYVVYYFKVVKEMPNPTIYMYYSIFTAIKLH